ncbi:flagellar brake protein [Undibacterium sp.]|jgi:c-di-GMP-binding flagellar brake protein YcgR|uniref:flagellar brake protein n=1 Tax=Undibacterium sp. TaxID=1914977 RepID=UPI002C8E1EAB|nr:flagellar brake protein [Undibacterium sp.]HTD03358.1 flagellar brake protein [Undibacterium sp.]
MGDISALTAINPTDITVGQPLPWPIYDVHGNLLFESGMMIETQQQLERLVINAYCMDSLWNTVPAREVVETPPAATEQKEEDARDQMIELDSVRWSVGEKLFLQMQDNAATRFTVKMIGFLKGKSIVVSAPTIDGGAPRIRDGQLFIVRAFTGKTAYAFTASALKSVFFPYSYLHLSYPAQVRSTVIRQGSRANVKIIASVMIGSAEHTTAGVLNDMSTGGASGIIKKSIGEKGDTGIIKFKVKAAGNDEILTLNFILRSVEPVENEDGYRYGFQFVDLDTQSRLILSAFVHQTLVEAD